ARTAREHDGLVRGVDPLVTKRGGGLAHSLPRFLQALREIRGESDLGRRPAIVLLALLDRLLAVITDSTGHAPIFAYPEADNGSETISRLQPTNPVRAIHRRNSPSRSSRLPPYDGSPARFRSS